jgi:endoribonuclease Dicer
MAEIASNREPEDSHPNFFPTEEINENHITTTGGAKITIDSIISVHNHYLLLVLKVPHPKTNA